MAVVVVVAAAAAAATKVCVKRMRNKEKLGVLSILDECNKKLYLRIIRF